MNTNVLKDYDFSSAVRYHYGKFPPSEMDYVKLLGPLRRAASALARYDEILNRLHNKDLLLAPLRRQEAVISSRIEGTVATLDEVLSYEADTEADPTDAAKAGYRQEIAEVHSYIRALNAAQRMIEEDKLPICGRLIKAAHSRMLFWGRGADKQPGHFKQEQNYVVDQKSRKVLFIPIDEKSLEPAFKVYEEYVNGDDCDPLIQTALAHLEFEALHPFKDGNGRIGRMLITLMLWQKGIITGPFFYISGNLEERRDEYIDRMRNVSAIDAWTEWCVFFLQALEAQANENIAICHEMTALYEDMKERFRKLLASQWAITALDFIFSKPIFKNSQFTLGSGIPRPTAARFSQLLVKEGLLTTRLPASGRRAATYAFEPLLSIVRRS